MPFIHGCNYPWSASAGTIFYGLDFGANIWGSHLGVSTRRAEIESDFQRMASLGFTLVRWFVFCDGRAGIVYDETGFPSGPDEYLYADLDAALEAARESGIRLVLVLLDHRWMFDNVRDTFADPITGELFEGTLPDGRAQVLRTRRGHDALLANLLIPVFTRYGPGGARADLGSVVFAWELMNEPDFIIEEWEHDVSARVRRPIPFATLSSLVARFSSAVHTLTMSASTIGGARARNLWAWDDSALGLDVLQVHQYPDVRHPERDDNLFGVAKPSLGVHADVVIGEYPGDPLSRHPKNAWPAQIALEEYLELALAQGYLGLWPWSFSGTDDYGTLPVEALQAFGRRHPALVNTRFEG